MGNRGIGGTAGDSRVDGNGEATTSTDNSPRISREKMVATKGGVGNSSTSYSHAVICNYPTKHQRRVQRYSNRKNAAMPPKKCGLASISQRCSQRGTSTAVARQLPQRSRRSDSTTYKTPFREVMAGACMRGACIKRNNFVGILVNIPTVPA